MNPNQILMFGQQRVMVGNYPFIEITIKPKRCSECNELVRQEVWIGDVCDKCHSKLTKITGGNK